MGGGMSFEYSSPSCADLRAGPLLPEVSNLCACIYRCRRRIRARLPWVYPKWLVPGAVRLALSCGLLNIAVIAHAHLVGAHFGSGRECVTASPALVVLAIVGWSPAWSIG